MANNAADARQIGPKRRVTLPSFRWRNGPTWGFGFRGGVVIPQNDGVINGVGLGRRRRR